MKCRRHFFTYDQEKNQTAKFYTQNRKNVLYYIMVNYRQVLLSTVRHIWLANKRQTPLFKRSGGPMSVSYKKLFKLLIDKDLKKKDLREMAGIGNSTMTKLANNENVTMEVMAKICSALDCKIDDVVEILPDEK